MTRTAQIAITNLSLRVTPGELESVLRAVLSFPATRFQPGGPLGYRQVPRSERAYRRNSEGVLVIPTGLLALTQQKLNEAGWQVVVQDQRRLDSWVAPSPETLNRAQGAVQAFWQTVAREPKGVFEAGSQGEVVELIASICRLFPRARVMIALNGTRKKLQSLRRQLVRAGAGEVYLLNAYPWPWAGGRLVCQLGHLNDADKSPDRLFDVVILPSALQALGAVYRGSLARLSRQRVYGFVPGHAALSPKARLDLQAMIGPFLPRAQDFRGAEAAVTVHWAQPPWSPPAGEVSALERKRQAYWHNDARNAYVAAVAGALSESNREHLWKYGLMLVDDDASLSLDGNLPAVTVLVESTEHARELRLRLPGWDLVSGLPRAERMTPVTNPCKVRPLAKTLLTYVAAAKLTDIDSDVLLVAGGEWPTALRAFPPRNPARRQALVIDLADDFDPLAKEAVRSRLRAYAARGWKAEGEPPWAVRSDDGTGR